MTEHQVYSFIYIFLTWILTLFISERIKRMPDLYLLKRNNYSKAIILFMVFMILFIGFRSSGVGGDTGSYMNKYQKMMDGLYEPGESVKDRLFQSFQYMCSQMMSVSLFFLIVACLYITPIYIACKRIIRNNATYLLLAAMGAFSFFSYGVNGIRNGLATSLVFLALSYISGNIKSKLWCAILCFIAINCHGSALLPVIAMLIAFLIRYPKLMFCVWGGSVLVSLVVGQSVGNIFMTLGLDQRMAHYMTLDNTAETESAIAAAGFRWDFLIYSFMPILMGWYCIFKKKICDSNYHLLLGTYIYSNAVWVVLIRIPYSNRFAYLSWFLYAIVLTYPLFKFHIWRNQGRKVAMILMAHVSFTFLMFFYTGL